MNSKLKWLLLMPILLTPPYAITNRLRLFAPYEVPQLALDKAIPFTPELAWLYFMLFPFMWLAVILQKTDLEAKSVVIGATIVAWCTALIFLFFPTIFPRPHLPIQNSIYAAVVFLDTPYNSCPSLHGTFSVYSGLWLCHAFKNSASRLALFLMVILIFYATISVRQHGIIDLIVGGIMGLITYLLTKKFLLNKSAK